LKRVKASGVLIAFIFICCGFSAFAQGGTSNQGKEFWTAFMSHIYPPGDGASLSRMNVYITADEDTKGVVSITDGSFPSIPFEVVAKQVKVITIPSSAYIYANSPAKSGKGIHIVAEKKVAVYAHIYASTASGATLLLPVNVLGKTYTSINYTQESNSEDNTNHPENNIPSYSAFMVIATEDNTTVNITPSQDLLGGQLAGHVFQVVLMKGEVYQGLSKKDLTTTQIQSVISPTGECKKIAVFSGSTKIGIGCRTSGFSSDNLFQQVYPTASWGKNYISIPLKNRHYDMYRIVLSDLNTEVKINGSVVNKALFQNPYFYQFSSTQPQTITANKPIQVAQYAVTQGNVAENSCENDATDQGDPEMIYLNPLEQTLDHVTLYSSPYYQITKHYINVVIKADKASTFKFDGVPYTNFTTILNGGGYAYAQIEVAAGTHYLDADDGFNAIAYGFGGNESYGYSAGTNLKNLTEYIVLHDPQSTSTQLNGCTGGQYKLELVLPYQTSKITWNFNNGSAPQTFNNPVSTAFITDGKTLYRYEYPGTTAYPKGSYSYTATVDNLTNECGATKDIDFDFNITDYANVAFTPVGNLCSADAVTIHNETIADPGKVSKIKIYWDYLNHPDVFETFNTGDFPVDDNYHHLYAKATTDIDYTVKMIVYTGEGALCDNAVEHVLTVRGNPLASFDAVGPMCQDAGPVQLISHHDGFTGTGVFSGTGVSANGVFDPAVAGAGKFTITYTFTADNLCPVVAPPHDIVVNPLPIVNAGKYMQLLEGEPALLPAKVSGGGSGFTYVWEPAIGLDNANALNPLCSVAENRWYKLTVTTAAGCTAHDEIYVKVLKKPIVVNAFTPNGDGVNDTWKIEYLDTYPGSTVDIYNRQGERVYSSVGYASAWDGRFKGNVLPTGTYYYIINPKNGRKVISGNVTIIK